VVIPQRVGGQRQVVIRQRVVTRRQAVIRQQAAVQQVLGPGRVLGPERAGGQQQDARGRVLVRELGAQRAVVPQAVEAPRVIRRESGTSA
jgi:hypothetical protein